MSEMNRTDGSRRRTTEPEPAARAAGRGARWLAGLIDAFARAEGPPPDRLLRFLAWALRGAFPAIGVAFVISILVGATEVISAAMIGWLIDLAQRDGPAGLFAESWHLLLAAFLFFLVLRPGLLGLSAAVNALTLGPNLYPLVLSRLNRHTLGQSLSFFDDDFAGRIAQKQQQTARAITEAVTETVNTFGLAVTAIIGSAAVVAVVNPILALAIVVWVGSYAILSATTCRGSGNSLRTGPRRGRSSPARSSTR